MRVAVRASLAWGLVLGLVAQVGAQTKAPAAPPAAPPTMQQRMQQMLEFAKTHYEKHEYRIAMRDGVKLYTQVYTPIAGQFADKGPYPFLMTRTAYSCGSYDNRRGDAARDEQYGHARERVHPGVPGCARPVGERRKLGGDDSAEGWQGH